jgi:signal transduction histidine kinase
LATVLERYGEQMSAIERADFAGRIVRQSERATRLVRGYLQAPDDQAGPGADDTHASQPCQPAEVLTAVVEECSLLLRARSLDTEVTIRDVRRVVAGADYVHRILLNLVDNAAKFAASSTTIGLDVRADGPAVAIEVISTGHGIDPGQVSVMFEPGGRLPTGAAAPGTGLGLAIVADLVASAGGSVHVDVDGSRTTVVVALPAVLERAPVAAG